MPRRPSTPRDAIHVNVQDTHDVRYWCGKLQCTEYQLRDAVAHVGAMPSNIEAYLRQKSYGLEHVKLPPGRKPS